ncbi:hypothetical protein ASE16_02390 [Leifsonia sp. Root227]|uniref:hypothetical protein n=1 Tax=Leifsonia sp. Root227 TaxID=1736496 RepID=UPI0006FAB4F3|nr:hypothetical protein [Leifsonia sp. Root227]KRC51937.1 hypothetical protein ASE16_02390 [Leifsonia sp. Root227]
MTAPVQNHYYLTDTYLLEIDSDVVASGTSPDGAWIAFKSNIFHPQGGGQPADTGYVEGVPVIAKRDHESGLVIVSANSDHPLPALQPGASAHASVDRTRRLGNAALHTAGHLIEALVQPWQWRTVGNNHFPGQSRVEFISDDFSNLVTEDGRARLTAELRTVIRDAIAADLPTSAVLMADGTRTVSVGNLHTVPCGGTHVASLAELHNMAVPDLRVKKSRIKASYTVDHRDAS